MFSYWGGRSKEFNPMLTSNVKKLKIKKTNVKKNYDIVTQKVNLFLFIHPHLIGLERIKKIKFISLGF